MFKDFLRNQLFFEDNAQPANTVPNDDVPLNENNAETKIKDGKATGENSSLTLAELEKRFNEREKFWSSKFDSVNGQKTKLEKEFEEAKKAQMTEAQKHQYEMEQKQKVLQEKEFELSKRETEILKRDVLKEHGLMDLTDFNLGSDKESIGANATKIKSIIDNAVNAKINEFMSKNGYKPTDNKQTNMQNNDDLSANALMAMSEEELKKLSPDTITKILQKK